MSTRTIIIGDVHGCRAELEALIAKVIPRKGDTVIFAGDLFDRGPDSAGVVRVARKLSERKGIKVVLVEGNHDEKHRRFRAHLARFRSGGSKVPIADAKGKKTAINDALSAADVAFLDKAVLFHRIPEHDMLVVHGGVTPLVEELPADGSRLCDFKGKAKKLFAPMIRVRYVDIEGTQMTMAKTDPSIHLTWMEAYDGRFGRVVYGHEPYVDAAGPVEGYLGMSVGIDLGCVFGGRLCALVVNEDGTEEAVTVEAFDRYASRSKRPVRQESDRQLNLDLAA